MIRTGGEPLSPRSRASIQAEQWRRRERLAVRIEQHGSRAQRDDGHPVHDGGRLGDGARAGLDRAGEPSPRILLGEAFREGRRRDTSGGGQHPAVVSHDRGPDTGQTHVDPE